MKFLIASDLHGSFDYANLIIQKAEQEGADKIILLGDLYYHGPRNPLPQNYASLSVSKLLNENREKIIALKGNCDSEVDQMISDFDLIENLILISGEKTIFLSHGHKYNIDSLPKTKCDMIIYGHFHKAFIKEQNGITFANPGSIALPKDDFRGYLILEEGKLTLKNI